MDTNNNQPRESFFFIMFNLVRVVTTHCLGKHHTKAHRKMFGFGFMIFGIAVIHALEFIHHDLKFPGEVLGTYLSGVGVAPFAELED